MERDGERWREIERWRDGERESDSGMEMCNSEWTAVGWQEKIRIDSLISASLPRTTGQRETERERGERDTQRQRQE